MSDSVAKALALAALAYKGEHRSGNYPDIANKPKINNITILGNHNSNYYKLPLLDETGNSIQFEADSEFNLTVKLLNKAGDIISEDSLDLPIEGLIMDGRYEEDSEGKGYLVLVLQNGHEISIPLEDLIDELATKEYVDALFDSEAQIRQKKDEELKALLDSEAELRIAGDSELQTQIDELVVALDSEAELRIEGDSELEEQIIILSGRLDSETNARILGDSELRALVDSEAIIREQEDLKLHDLIDSETEARILGDSELKNLLDSEAAIRAHQYEQLCTDLDSEAQTREDTDLWLEFLIDSEGNTRREQIRAFREDFDREVAARIAGDSELAAKIELKQDKFTTEGPIVLHNDILKLNYDSETLTVDSEGKLVVIGGGSGTTAYLNGVLLDSEATSIDAKIYWYGTQAEYDELDSEAKKNPNTLFFVESSEGTIESVKSYYELEDKPAINGVTLSGDKTLSTFGIQPTLTVGRGLSMANNTVSLNVRDDANNAIKIDTSNRVYADAYTKEETRMLFGGVFASNYVTELPETLSRNCFYLVGNAAPFTTFFVDSNGIEHYIGRLSPGQGTRSYIAGEGIDISSEGVISATGGGGSSVVPDPMDVIDNPSLDYSLYLMYTPSRGLYWAPQKK